MKTNTLKVLAFLGVLLITILVNCKKEEENTAPVAQFTISPGQGSMLTAFTFDASGSSDKEDQVQMLQARWDWEGDGIFDTDYSTNKILNHQFLQNRTYQVILEIMDSKGLSASVTKSLEVGFGPVPTVITAQVTDTTANTVTCGGEVTDIGGTEVTARGVCWMTSPNPAITDNITSDGAGPGTFTSHITGLTPSTVYYVRAYATNSAGTAYGAALTFTTTEEVNSPPVAEFTITPGEGTVLTIFNFDATSCSDPEDLTETLQVRWDWENDGLFDTDFSTNKVLNHQFTEVGTYQVILEVKDTKGLSTSTVKTLEVSIGPAPIVITAPVTDTTAHSANCGGEVTDIGGTEVTARGVCWNTSPNPTITDYLTIDGEGPGIFTSHMSGLESNTLYYVRAYATNGAGTSYGDEENFTTNYVWPCGETITINHVEGSIAPVSKTVIYGTVTGISGEPEKCWITSNLGADHQATALDDISEQSAGWFWQFNQAQGYKHDGTTRTPNTAWVDPIYETSDWLPANDPCTIELQGGWRIPTSSEWSNVNASGGWTNWNDPWNSALKLHAAGTLKYLDGTVDRRGIIGYFWSSSQYNSESGWALGFRNDFSQMWGNGKSHGFNIRCLLDN
jgi:PKD repeat protein